MNVANEEGRSRRKACPGLSSLRERVIGIVSAAGVLVQLGGLQRIGFNRGLWVQIFFEIFRSGPELIRKLLEQRFGNRRIIACFRLHAGTLARGVRVGPSCEGRERCHDRQGTESVGSSEHVKRAGFFWGVVTGNGMRQTNELTGLTVRSQILALSA